MCLDVTKKFTKNVFCQCRIMLKLYLLHENESAIRVLSMMHDAVLCVLGGNFELVIKECLPPSAY